MTVSQTTLINPISLTGGALAIEMPARLIDPDLFDQFAARANTLSLNTSTSENGADLWLWARFLIDKPGHGFDRVPPRLQPELPIWHEGTAQELAEHLLQLERVVEFQRELKRGDGFITLTRVEPDEPSSAELTTLTGDEAFERLNKRTRPRRRKQQLRDRSALNAIREA